MYERAAKQAAAERATRGVQPPTPINDRVFNTVIGTRFVGFNELTEIELPDRGICSVTGIKIKYCSVTWQLRFGVESWGIKTIAVKPVIVSVDAVIEYQLEGDQEIGVEFNFTPDNTDIELDTNEFNPLVNGIAPTSVDIQIKTDDPANVKIKF